MAGTLYNSAELDTNGRQLVLDDSILDVHYYTTVGESWDRTGGAQSSWYLENFLPNDSFNEDSLSADRWGHRAEVAIGSAAVQQSGGQVEASLTRDEGVSSLTSDGRWRLTGDFDIRLYIDWASYYNEYRSIAHTFLKVGVDGLNAARLCFTFDGEDTYQLRSEKVVARDPKFLGWLPSGSFTDLVSFNGTGQILFFRITRESGVIRTYYSNGVTSTQVGDDITDAALAADVYVEFGVEGLQYNTLKAAFTKFFVASGELSETTEFFSSIRGRRQEFPERAILTVDPQSFSIIDEDRKELWMRVIFDEGGALTSSSFRVRACEGTVYCATSDGLVAFDFKQDKIFKYKGSDILVADEPIALRNAGVAFRMFAAGVGDIQDNNIHDVACRIVGGDEYIAFTHDSGVTVMRALASGVAYSGEGPLPGSRVEISEKGALFWSGYDQLNNDGELSYFSNITALAALGTNSFARTDYYSPDTAKPIFGANITSFDVRTASGADHIAVGTTEGITYIPPNAISRSFGVSAPADNPFTDPSFENYLGLDWKQFYTGFHSLFRMHRVDSFVTEGEYALQLMFLEPGVAQQILANTALGVYQDVNLTGVERVYYDIQLFAPQALSTSSTAWDFEVVVGDTVVRSHRDVDGPFTKFNDSANVVSFDGVQRVKFQIRNTKTHNIVGLSSRTVVIDNLKTKIGDPGFRILPPGNASVVEVLMQYDSEGHKVYFSTAEGYGAVDLDDNSLDYFIPLSTQGPAGGETQSSDFTRVTDES